MTRILDFAKSTKSAAFPIKTIGEMFDALAVDWTASGRCRKLVAGDHWQFIRVIESGDPNIFYKMTPFDIEIESGAYRLRGFAKFEAESMFKGMFKVSESTEGDWISAELTEYGFQIAKQGLFDFDDLHKDIRRYPFFNSFASITKQDTHLLAKV